MTVSVGYTVFLGLVPCFSVFFSFVWFCGSPDQWRAYDSDLCAGKLWQNDAKWTALARARLTLDHFRKNSG